MIKIGALLKALAPTVAQAAGGPMASMAVKMVASKLGSPDASVDKIEEILQSQPEKAVLVKQADREFGDRIREMEIDLESFRAEVDDRKDARAAFATDLTPKLFSVLTLLLYGAFVILVTTMPHDQNDETIISLVLGQLSGILGTAAAFYYGGSNGKK